MMFGVVSALVVVLPWVLDVCFPSWKVTMYAPGAAILLGVAYAIWAGQPASSKISKSISRLLGVVIVATGCGMKVSEVIDVGASGLIYTALGISLTVALGVFLGRSLKMERNTYLLTSIGTAICGGSAIAAAAPVLKAKSHEIAFATATVFILNGIALILFPILGHVLGFSQEQFGTWAALAVHDTRSVIGTTSAYGDVAKGVGVTLKLLRALWIVPVTLALSYWIGMRLAKETGEQSKLSGAKVPWFIPGFVIAALFFTYVPGLLPEALGDGVAWIGKALKTLSKYILILALFWVGASLSIEKVKKVGIRPFVHGMVLWVVIASAWCLYLKFCF